MSLSANFTNLAKLLLQRNDRLDQSFYELVDLLEAGFRRGGRLFIAGNGGSASDANHLAAEFVGAFEKHIVSLDAESLCADMSVITAIANDFGYEHTFSMQLQAKSRPGDVFLGITTSGNSKNILEAVKWCRANGVEFAVLTSGSGGKLQEYRTKGVVVCVPEAKTDQVQTMHNIVYHTLIEEIINRGLALKLR